MLSIDASAGSNTEEWKPRMRRVLDARCGGYEPWEFFVGHVSLLLAREYANGEEGDTWKGVDMCYDRWKNTGKTVL